jgi:outer membrane protein TolC
LWIVACTGTAFSETWTLDRTVQAALAVSSSAEIGRLDAASSNADALSARMAWFPAVSVSAAANYVNKVMEITVPGRTIRFGDNDSYDFKLRVSQLIYDGGRLRTLRDAGLDRAEMNAHQAEASELSAEFQAKTAFYTVALARETIAASDESIREANNHHADVLALREQGMALEDDVLLSRLRISQAEMSRVTCEADLERAQAAFRKVAGLAPDAEVSIDWSPPLRPDPAAADAVTAFRNRPEFKALEASLRSAGKTTESARAGHLPTLGFSGAFNYGKPGLDQPKNEWMHYFTGGVSLNWNLWDWGAVNRDVEKADIARKKTEKIIEDLKLAVARQVSEAMAGYREANRRASLAEESAEYAKRHLELVSASFKNGTATERDYDSAHALFTRALHDAAAARIGKEIGRAQIEYVLGIRYRGDKP